jgi:hypothetical protein
MKPTNYSVNLSLQFKLHHNQIHQNLIIFFYILQQFFRKRPL